MGRLNAGAVAENWRLSTRSVVDLAQTARSQVYHTERPPTRSPCCSASRGVRQPQRILVHTVAQQLIRFRHFNCLRELRGPSVIAKFLINIS